VKKLFFFIQGLFIYPFLALPAFAATPAPGSSNVNPCVDQGVNNPISKALCGLGGINTAQTIQNVVIFFVVLAVIIALLYLLYGGVKWIMSKGDKTEVEAAQKHVVAAIVGLIVVFLAVFIVSIVLSAFGIEFKNLEIPKIISNITPTP